MLSVENIKSSEVDLVNTYETHPSEFIVIIEAALVYKKPAVALEILKKEKQTLFDNLDDYNRVKSIILEHVSVIYEGGNSK